MGKIGEIGSNMKIIDNIMIAFLILIFSISVIAIMILIFPFLLIGIAVLISFVFIGMIYEYMTEFFRKGDNENGV